MKCKFCNQELKDGTIAIYSCDNHKPIGLIHSFSISGPKPTTWQITFVQRFPNSNIFRQLTLSYHNRKTYLSHYEKDCWVPDFKIEIDHVMNVTPETAEKYITKILNFKAFL